MTTMERSRYEREKINKFIELVSHHPTIWDIKSKEYRYRDLKKETIGSVAKEMDWTDLQVQEKFRNLRTYYIREKHKINKSKKSGSSSSDVYKTNWEFYDALDAFLADSVQPSQGFSNQSNNDCDSDENEETTHEISPDKVEEMVPKSKRRRQEYDLMKTALDILKEPLPAPAPALSSDALWAQMITKQLESISDKRVKENLKIKFQQMIIDAQFPEERCPDSNISSQQEHAFVPVLLYPSVSNPEIKIEDGSSPPPS